MPTQENLRHTLAHIDGRSYNAYKDIRGTYTFPTFTLHIDHVQGDPFAAPSRLRLRLPQKRAGYPPETFANKSRRLALCTYLAGQFADAAQRTREQRGSGKSGLIEIDAPGQQILERTCIDVKPEYLEARFVVGLPAAGRRVLGHQAAAMLCEDIPTIMRQALLYENNDATAIDRYTHTSEDADFLRDQLEARALVAFVANHSILPRRTGVDDRPLQNAVPFQSPAALQTEFDLPHAGKITGMGIPRGVTLIVGGGFHGKSTLLYALQRGVYNHRPDDGREQVVAHPGAVKIRAEDGRRVAGVDISPFINTLPYGRDTRNFSTDNASGSTSQAANTIEALEAGATLLLIDEDTAATNFMIRDVRMQQLIAKKNEPITPFIDRVRQLYDEYGVSTVLVVGGSGDYFEVADSVIAMENFIPREVTQEAKNIAAAHATRRQAEGGACFGALTPRIPLAHSIDPSKGRRDVNIKSQGVRTILFGTEAIDLDAVEQLVDPSQTRALAAALLYARQNYMDGRRTLRQVLDRVMAAIEIEGLDVLSPYPVGDHARFRPFELAAALSRLRTLEVQQG
jgi:predicted ABC-class ATPase